MHPLPSEPRSLKTPSALLLGILVLASILAGILWQTHEAPSEPGVPVVAEGTDLPHDVQAEQGAEAAREIQRLQVVLAELEKTPATLPGTVAPEKAAAIVQRLDELQEVVGDPRADAAAVRSAFEEVDDLWRERLTSLQELLEETEGPVPYALPPYLPHVQDRTYRQMYALAEAKAEARLGRLTRAYDADVQGRSERLRRIVVLRGATLARLHALGATPALDDPGRWLRDSVFEITSYPARKRGLLHLELLDLRKRSPGDVAWTLNLVQEVGLGLLAVLLPLVAARSARRADRTRAPGATRVAGWLVTWVVATVSGPFLTGTVVESLRPLPDLAAYYAAFRLYLVFLELVLSPVLDRILLEESPDRPGSARRPLEVVGLLLFGRAVIVRIVTAVTGPGVLLATARSVLDVAVPVLAWFATWLWRRELSALIRHLVPAPAGPTLAGLIGAARTGWLLAPFGALVVVVLGTLQSVLAHASRFEVGKQVSAGLLRRWMETSVDREIPTLPPPPAEYRKRLLEDPLPVPEPFLQEVRAPLERWKAGQEGEPVLTVRVPPGSDGQTLCRRLAEEFRGSLRIVGLHPPGRITDARELRELLGGTPETPTLVLVPDAARLFLSTVGGFEAWRELQVLVRNWQFVAFWVLVMPAPTGNYLRALSAGDVAMSRTLNAPRWSDDDLRRLILARHETTGLTYRFDGAVVQAARATPGATPESQFFKVLWQVSEGNPQVALHLWLDSVHLDPSGSLRVGLPTRHAPGVLASHPAVVGFVLAALFRHAALTLPETVRATGLPERRVYLACERLLEEGILEIHADGRMLVTPLWLGDVRRHLEGRNLLDG